MFVVKEINENIVNLAWNKSKNASLFCHPLLIKNLGYNARYVGGYKNNELIVIWPLVMINNSFSKPPLFSYYFGPYWVENKYQTTPYKMFKNNLEIFNKLIPFVQSISPKLVFSLTPEFLDLRPFQWFNYNRDDESKFNIDLKYTALYDLKKINTTEDLILSFRSDDKRKKARKILKEKKFQIVFKKTKETDKYINLYKNSLYRSGGKINNDEIYALEKILSISNSNSKFNNSVQIEVLELYIDESPIIHGFQLLLTGKDKVYALTQCVSDEARELNGSVALTLNALIFSKQKYSFFDFNGANSPLRADDKHSYSADIVSYFELSIS